MRTGNRGRDLCGACQLAGPIAAGWSAATSVDANWTPDAPSVGQCAVTALVVQDHFGGVLVRALNEGVSHYWNRLDDGTEIDMTRDQFARWEPTDIEIRSREYVLSFPETRRRYELLRERVSA